MAEPEEESDEEWQRIAEAVGIFEQQFNQARATAQGLVSTAGGTLGGQAGQAGPAAGPEPQAALQLQAVQTREAIAVQTPTRQLVFPSPTPPPAGTSGGEQTDWRVGGLSEALAQARAENERLRTEHTTRVRHLEARVGHATEAATLRSRLGLAERELRELRVMRTGPTQAGEVVEATQTGLDVLKASVRPRRERVRERVVWGCRGVDERFREGLIRERVFRRVGDGLVRVAGVGDGRGVGCVVAAARGEWDVVVRGLVELLDGEAWSVGIAGLREVVLLSEKGRREAVTVEVVERVLRIVQEGGVDDALVVLEGVLTGCGEVGMAGDDVRKVVVCNDYINKLFRGGHAGAARVIENGVVAALEAEDGRVCDDEWGRVEGALTDATRLIGDTRVGNSCVAMLCVCCVLAPDVLARVGGVDALLSVVVDGILGGDETRLWKALIALREAAVGGVLRPTTAMRLVALPALLDLHARKHSALAVAVINALYQPK